MARLKGGETPSQVQRQVVELFEQLRTPLLRYLSSVGLAAGDAEDVLQDTFIALFHHLRAGKPQDNLRAWLYRVARNLALKSIQQREPDAGAEPELLQARDESANPEQQAVQTQRDRTVRAIIAALPPVDRQCVLLRAEGLRYREIAEVLDISLGSVAASLSRTLSRIARATQPEK